MVAFFVGVAGLIMVLLVVGRNASFKRNAALRELAGRLGFEYGETPGAFKWLPPSPTVQGRFAGRPARIHEFTTGSGKSRKSWVAARISCASAGGLQLSIRTQGPAILEKFAGMFGYKDIVIGDAGFDSRFAIGSNDEAFIKAALIPEVRGKIEAFWTKSSGGRLSIEGGESSWVETGTLSGERSRANVERSFAVLSDLAAIAEVHRR